MTESVKAYGVGTHRHQPEIQAILQTVDSATELVFTPHLMPMIRGIHATVYADARNGGDGLQSMFEQYYRTNRLSTSCLPGSHPETRSVRGANVCRIAAHYLAAQNKIVVLSVEDNLVKGAASQAIQNMNLMFGIDETTGLESGVDALSSFASWIQVKQTPAVEDHRNMRYWSADPAQIAADGFLPRHAVTRPISSSTCMLERETLIAPDRRPRGLAIDTLLQKTRIPPSSASKIERDAYQPRLTRNWCACSRQSCSPKRRSWRFIAASSRPRMRRLRVNLQSFEVRQAKTARTTTATKMILTKSGKSTKRVTVAPKSS